MFKIYSIIIQYFYSIYSYYSYYKIMTVVPHAVGYILIAYLFDTQ